MTSIRSRAATLALGLVLSAAAALFAPAPARAQTDVNRELRQFEDKLKVSDFEGARKHLGRCDELIAGISDPTTQGTAMGKVGEARDRLDKIESDYWVKECERSLEQADYAASKPGRQAQVERCVQQAADAQKRIRIAKLAEQWKKRVDQARDRLVEEPKRRLADEAKAAETAARLQRSRAAGEVIIAEMGVALEHGRFDDVRELARKLGEHLRAMEKEKQPEFAMVAEALEARGLQAVAAARFKEREQRLLAELKAAEQARAEAQADAARLAAEKAELAAREQAAKAQAAEAQARLDEVTRAKAEADAKVDEARKATEEARAAAAEARAAGSAEAERLTKELESALAAQAQAETARGELEARSREAEAQAAERARNLAKELESVKQNADEALAAAARAAREAEERAKAAEAQGSAEAERLQQALGEAKTRLEAAEAERSRAAAEAEAARAEAVEVERRSRERAEAQAAELEALKAKAEADLDAAKQAAVEAERRAAESAGQGGEDAAALRQELEAARARLEAAEAGRARATADAEAARAAAQAAAAAAEAREAELKARLQELEGRAQENKAARAALEAELEQARVAATEAERSGSTEAAELKAALAATQQKLEAADAERRKLEAESRALEAEARMTGGSTGSETTPPAGDPPVGPGTEPATTTEPDWAARAATFWETAIAGQPMVSAEAIEQALADPSAGPAEGVALLKDVVEGVVGGGASLASLDGDVYRSGDHVLVLHIPDELRESIARARAKAALEGAVGEASVLGKLVGVTGVVAIDESGAPKPGTSKTVPLFEVTAIRFEKLAVALGKGASTD